VTDLLAGTMNFVVAIPSTLVGAFCGWVIGLTPFGVMVLNALAALGVEGATLPEFGALIGFVSGFFSTRWRSKDD
jgi:hypothetical protein